MQLHDSSEKRHDESIEWEEISQVRKRQQNLKPNNDFYLYRFFLYNFSIIFECISSIFLRALTPKRFSYYYGSAYRMPFTIPIRLNCSLTMIIFYLQKEEINELIAAVDLNNPNYSNSLEELTQIYRNCLCFFLWHTYI